MGRSREQQRRRRGWKSSWRELKMKEGRRQKLPEPRSLRKRIENTKRRRGGSVRQKSKGSWNMSSRGRLIWRRGRRRKQPRRRRKGKPRRRGGRRRRLLKSRGKFGSSSEKPPWKSCRRCGDNPRRFGRTSPRSWLLQPTTKR